MVHLFLPFRGEWLHVNSYPYERWEGMREAVLEAFPEMDLLIW